MDSNAAPSHVARVVSDWLHETGIKVLSGLAQLPTFNPIEHVGDVIYKGGTLAGL